MSLHICGVVGTTPLTCGNDARHPSVSQLLIWRRRPGFPVLLTETGAPGKQEVDVFKTLHAYFSDCGVYLAAASVDSSQTRRPTTEDVFSLGENLLFFYPRLFPGGKCQKICCWEGGGLQWAKVTASFRREWWRESRSCFAQLWKSVSSSAGCPRHSITLEMASALAAAPFGNRSRCQTHGERWNIWNMFPPVMTPIVFFTGERPQLPCFDKGRSIYLSCHFLKLPIFLSHRSCGPSGCCSAPLAVLLTTSSVSYLHQPLFLFNS